MTTQEMQWLETMFNNIQKDITAVIVQNGVLKAEARAFRDAMCKVQDNPKISGDELFRYWALQAESYYSTVEVAGEAALRHALHIVKGGDARPPA